MSETNHALDERHIVDHEEDRLEILFQKARELLDAIRLQHHKADLMLLQRRKNVFFQDAIIVALICDVHNEFLLEEFRLADKAVKSRIGINLSGLPRRI